MLVRRERERLPQFAGPAAQLQARTGAFRVAQSLHVNCETHAAAGRELVATAIDARILDQGALRRHNLRPRANDHNCVRNDERRLQSAHFHRHRKVLAGLRFGFQPDLALPRNRGLPAPSRAPASEVIVSMRSSPAPVKRIACSRLTEIDAHRQIRELGIRR